MRFLKRTRLLRLSSRYLGKSVQPRKCTPLAHSTNSLLLADIKMKFELASFRFAEIFSAKGKSLNLAVNLSQSQGGKHLSLSRSAWCHPVAPLSRN